MVIFYCFNVLKKCKRPTISVPERVIIPYWYLVVNINNQKIINVFDKIWRFIEQRIISNGIWKFVENEITFNNSNNKIKEYIKLRFSSILDLPLDILIEFRALTLTISGVIEKDGKYYPEIYLDEGLYVQNY